MLRLFLNYLLAPAVVLVFAVPLVVTALGSLSWWVPLWISLLFVYVYMLVVGLPMYFLVKKRAQPLSYRRGALWGVLSVMPVMCIYGVMFWAPYAMHSFVVTELLMAGTAALIGFVFALLTNTNQKSQLLVCSSNPKLNLSHWSAFLILVVINIVVCNHIMNVRLFERYLDGYSWGQISGLNAQAIDIRQTAGAYLTFHVAPEQLPALLGDTFYEDKSIVLGQGTVYSDMIARAPFWWSGCEQPDKAYWAGNHHYALLLYVEKKQLVCYGRVDFY